MTMTSASVRYDTSPIGTGKNWVTKTDPVEGLGSFVRAIVHALMRNGHPKQEAIAIAEGVIKKWAAGVGTWGKSHHVTPQTQAKAQQAVAHWEALKAAARADDYSDIETRANAGPAGSKDQKAAAKGAKKSGHSSAPAKQAGSGTAKGDHAAGHPFYGNQHTANPNPNAVTTGGTGKYGGGNGPNAGAAAAKGGGGGGGGAGKAAAAAAKSAAAKKSANAAAATTAQQALQAAQAVAAAQRNVTAAAQRVKTAQDNLAQAQKQSAQDIAFAKGKEKAVAGVVQGEQNTEQVTLAAQGRIQSAQNAVAAAKDAMDSANATLDIATQNASSKQFQAVATYATAVNTRDGEEDVEVRKAWGRDLHHRAMGLSEDALKHSEHAVEAQKHDKVQVAAGMHDAAAEAFHSLGEAHRAAKQFSEAVAAYRVQHAHEALATTLRSTTSDWTVDQHESHAISVAHAKARKAVAEYSGHLATRDAFVGETTSDNSKLFLPVGPSKKQSADIIKEETNTHRFVGNDLKHCAKPGCGAPVVAPVHKAPTKTTPGQPIPPVPREAAHLRHRGTDGHEGTVTGHVAGKPRRHEQAAKARNLRNFTTIEAPLTDALKKHFGAQRSSTITRLTGKRGGRMLKRAAESMHRADDDQQDKQPPPPAETPDVSAGDIFDPVFWAGKTADVIEPHIAHAATLAAGEVSKQLNVPDEAEFSTNVWPGGSQQSVQDAVAERARAAAEHITGTTADQLTEAIQAGVAAGEGRDAIAKRVNDVFDNADMVRAKQIAQTVTVGAYNQAQTDYAKTLPKEVAGNKVWLAHDDDRTRPTHRVANGQERPMGAMYIVGGSQMDYPGDTTAPIGEWINCRCSQAFLPKGMTYAPLAAAAQAYVDALHGKPPPPVSPYKTGEAA